MTGSAWPISLSRRMSDAPLHLLFVCYGNICRSPMAEAILRHLIAANGQGERFVVDSAGVAAYPGQAPHAGTLRVLAHHGIEGRDLRSRRVLPADLQTFDLVLAMDRENLRDLRQLGPSRQPVELLLEYVQNEERLDVPDPFIVGGFEEVFELLEESCARLAEKLA